MHCIEFYTLEPIFNTKKYPTSYRSNFSPTPTTYRSILTNKGPYDRSLLKCRLPGVSMPSFITLLTENMLFLNPGKRKNGCRKYFHGKDTCSYFTADLHLGFCICRLLIFWCGGSFIITHRNLPFYYLIHHQTIQQGSIVQNQ